MQKKKPQRALTQEATAVRLAVIRLVTAAGVATINYILESDLLTHVKEISEYLDVQLQEIKEKFSIIKEIRGKGLLKGLVIDGNALEIVQTSN